MTESVRQTERSSSPHWPQLLVERNARGLPPPYRCRTTGDQWGMWYGDLSANRPCRTGTGELSRSPISNQTVRSFGAEESTANSFYQFLLVICCVQVAGYCRIQQPPLLMYNLRFEISIIQRWIQEIPHFHWIIQQQRWCRYCFDAKGGDWIQSFLVMVPCPLSQQVVPRLDYPPGQRIHEWLHFLPYRKNWFPQWISCKAESARELRRACSITRCGRTDRCGRQFAGFDSEGGTRTRDWPNAFCRIQ